MDMAILVNKCETSNFVQCWLLNLDDMLNLLELTLKQQKNVCHFALFLLSSLREYFVFSKIILSVLFPKEN